MRPSQIRNSKGAAAQQDTRARKPIPLQNKPFAQQRSSIGSTFNGPNQLVPPQSSDADNMEGGFSTILNETGLGNPLVTGIASNYIKQNVRFPFLFNLQMKSVSWVSWDYFRSYFRVNNVYVLYKLRILLFPFFHKNWTRAHAKQNANGEFDPLNPNMNRYDMSPIDDVNAPDLYLPLMAFITYILLMAYMMGLDGNFNPEVFGSTATSAFVVLFLENVVIKLGLYLLSVPSSPYFLDCIALTFYKFVHVNLTLFVDLFLGYTFYWISTIIFGMSMGIFIARSLQVTVSSKDTAKSKKLRAFLMVIGLLQILFILYLGQSVVISEK